MQVNDLNEFLLSSPQRMSCLIDPLVSNRPIYNVPLAFRIFGQLRVDALETAVSTIVACHPSLRTVIDSHNDELMQCILPSLPDAWEVIDFTDLVEDEREEALISCLDKEAKRPFNMPMGPLFRATIVKLTEEDHVLMLTLHQIISDRCSLEILLRELAMFYQQIIVGKPIEPSDVSMQYKGYGVMEHPQPEDDLLDLQQLYWKDWLADELPVLELPLDRKRPSIQTYNGTIAQFEIDPILFDPLKKLSQEKDSSLAVTLLAVYNILLARHSGQEDIIVGSPTTNRNQGMLESVIGHFETILPIRSNLTGNPTFEDFLQRVHHETLDVFSHEALAFNQIAKQISRDTEHNPIFQTKFEFQSDSLQLTLPDLETLFIPQHTGTVIFDLSLEMWEENGRLQGHFEYNPDLFDASTIEKYIGHLQTLLQSIVENSAIPIQHLKMLTDAERTMILEEWNNKDDDSIPESCLHWRFEEQVAKSPHALAVQFVNEKLTYQELNDKANQLANHLQNLGAGPGHIVGISMRRAPELLVAIWGILKCGAAYVPIDPNYPIDRIQYMFEDANIVALLTQKPLLDNLPQIDVPILCLDTQWDEVAEQPPTPANVEIKPNDPAYIIYTSGSTGNPKGVIVRHKSVVNYADTRRIVYDITSEDRFLQFASISFDTSIEEIFTTHLIGAALILRTEAMVDMHELLQRCHEWGVTLAHLSPAFWHELVLALEQGVGTFPPSFRMMIVGGDKILPERVTTWLKTVGSSPRLIQSYGPTELTVSVTMLEMSHIEVKEDVLPDIPLGWPIRNVKAYVLSKYQEPVPIGAIGELYLGGIQVAQGYLNRPELTADRFAKNPFIDDPEERLYKTGDLVKYRSDGKIEFVGRMDFQLKIRGYRIEPGEIQVVLNQFVSVQESLVVGIDDKFGLKQLVAYCVPIDGASLTSADLYAYVRERLPDYMVPSSFVILDVFPLTQNGKINRQSLPKPSEKDRMISTEYLAPRTKTEKLLAGIWIEVLQLEKVGIYDNFFDLGGHSLLAVRLFAQVEKIFGKKLSLPTLFEASTIEKIALLLDESQKDGQDKYQLDVSNCWAKNVVAVKPNGNNLPFFHMGGAVILRQLSKYLGDDQPLYGVLEQTLDENQALHTSVDAIVSDCVKAIQSVQPEGPYMLGGLCFGGIVALEIARTLQTQGHEIGLLALIEIYTLAAVRPTPEKRKVGRFALRIKYHWNESTENGIKGVLPYLTGKINKNFRVNHKKYKKRFYTVTGRPMSSNSRDIYETNLAARDQYEPAIFNGCATLFQATERPDWFEYDPDMGWGGYFTDGVEVIKISGDHLSIYDEPYVKEFGEQLKICIEKAQSKYKLKPSI